MMLNVIYIYIYTWIVYIVYIYIQYNTYDMFIIYTDYICTAYIHIYPEYIYIYTYTYCGGRMCKLFTLLLLRSSLFGSGENGVGKRLMVDGVGCF